MIGRPPSRSCPRAIRTLLKSGTSEDENRRFTKPSRARANTPHKGKFTEREGFLTKSGSYHRRQGVMSDFTPADSSMNIRRGINYTEDERVTKRSTTFPQRRKFSKGPRCKDSASGESARGGASLKRSRARLKGERKK